MSQPSQRRRKSVTLTRTHNSFTPEVFLSTGRLWCSRGGRWTVLPKRKCQRILIEQTVHWLPMGNDFKAALSLQDNEIVGQSVCHQQTSQTRVSRKKSQRQTLPTQHGLVKNRVAIFIFNHLLIAYTHIKRKRLVIFAADISLAGLF